MPSHLTPPTIVLSQLPDSFNHRLSLRVPDARIKPWPAGAIDTLPLDAQVLLPMPFARAGDRVLAARPAGWPFSLRWIQLFSTGLDYYPDWLFQSCVVTGSGNASARSVAEFAIAAILAAAKRLPESWITQAPDWQRGERLGMAEGAVLGIVGFGAIGRHVATLGLGLGMKVQITRRSSDPPDLTGVTRVNSLAQLFATSDHVVLALPGIATNDRIIDGTVLAQARPGLHLVNVARGRLIDDTALLAALADGLLSRATLDVTFPEPLPAGHPFYGHPRIRLSPHRSFDTADTESTLIATFAQNFATFRNGQPLHGLVNQ